MMDARILIIVLVLVFGAAQAVMESMRNTLQAAVGI
jgi:hypothetical protein